MSNKLGNNNLSEVYILLHMHCELMCKICPYCGVNGVNNDKGFRKKYVDIKRMKRSVLERFIDQVSDYSPRVITLSGGEPLEYSGWVDIAKYIKQKGMKVGISSNGLYFSDYKEDILKYVDSIMLDLGGTKEITSEIRCDNYGFDKVINGIIELNRLKKKYNQRELFLRICYVISDISYKYIKEFYEYFSRNNIQINNFYFQHLMYIDHDNLKEQDKFLRSEGLKALYWNGYLYDLKNIDFNIFLEQVRYLKRKKNVTFSPDLSDDEIKNYYQPEKKGLIKKNKLCKAPWRQVDLYPNGDIMTCPDYVIGNINKNSFDEIWNGEKSNRIRSLLKEKKGFPGCQSCFHNYVTNEDS